VNEKEKGQKTSGTRRRGKEYEENRGKPRQCFVSPLCLSYKKVSPHKIKLRRSKRVKHQATDTHDGVEVKRHLILTPALDIISILTSSDLFFRHSKKLYQVHGLASPAVEI
jgi:hypothetical protein